MNKYELDHDVAVIVLTRDGGPPPPRVCAGIAAQAGVRLRVHVVDGAPRPDDPNRWAAIARARNAGKRLGSAPWVMYLDDDVVLGPGCVARLVNGLRRLSGYAALAADYLGESDGLVDPQNGDGLGGLPVTRHVGMGATIFRREVLAFLAFRWESGRCECQCCCDDLRRAGFGIAYLPEAKARHVPGNAPRQRHTLEAAAPALAPVSGSRPQPPGDEPRVLAAFDRRHLSLFRRQFLPTLRASGNTETVTAVAYGLWPSEQWALAATLGVEVVPLSENGVASPVRRLLDFQGVVARWPENTPVAYWDAGDVIFQSRLGPLWDLARAYPAALLAVREPDGYPENPVVAAWTMSIDDPEARRFAFGLLSTRPFLNSGFAAGTARAMLRYLREAHRLRHSTALRGTSDWGDQTALNLYCHSDPGRWQEISHGWNYCLCRRDPRHYRVRPDGHFESTLSEPIHVVHGNDGTLRRTELSFLLSGLRL